MRDHLNKIERARLYLWNRYMSAVDPTVRAYYANGYCFYADVVRHGDVNRAIAETPYIPA